MKTVADLKINEEGEIKGFTDDALAIKLMEMNCLPGNKIKLLKKAPFGDPLIVDLFDINLVIRESEAKSILI
jgi:ferrous iron transport protein A